MLKRALGIAAAFTVAFSGSGHASPRIGTGDNMFSVNWAHFSVFQSNDPQTTTLGPRLGGSTSTSAGTEMSVSDADTVSVAFTHFFTDHLVMYLSGGYPPEFQATGHGTIKTSLGSVNEGQPSYQPLIKSVREWNPALIVGYYFNKPDANIRPYAGIGISYIWFTHVQMNNQYLYDQQATLDATVNALGGPLGLKSPVTLSAHASSTFAPVFDVGLSYYIASNLYASASVTYIPLTTTTELDVRDANGNALSVSRSHLHLNSVITTLGLVYSFSLW